jgi:hypothetical protein
MDLARYAPSSSLNVPASAQSHVSQGDFRLPSNEIVNVGNEIVNVADFSLCKEVEEQK